MVKTEQNYSYKHFIFKVENPNINKFIWDIGHTFFEENYDRSVHIHVKMAEIVTTDNGYTIIIVEYDPIANIDNLMSKYKEYTKNQDLEHCPDCRGTDFWYGSKQCVDCYTSDGKLQNKK